MKHSGKALIGIVVTVALLWWALREVDFRDVVAAIAGGDFALLGASIALTTFGFLIRAMRWAVFLEPVHPSSGLRSRFSAVAIHFMANNVIPLRVGEFARAWAFSRIEPVKATAAFGTVVVERFMDGVVLLILLVLPVFTPGFPDVGVLSEGWGGVVFKAAVVGVIAVVAVLVTMAAVPDRFVAVAKLLSPILPQPLREPMLFALESFLDSIGSLRSPRLLALGFLWTFGFWALQAASFWLGMRAFGIETGYVSAVFTSSVVAYAVALPAAPGYVGTFQAGALFALSEVYRVAEVQALAFAFGWHFGSFIPITAIGLYYAWRLGFSLGDVRGSEERLEHPERFDEDDAPA